MMRDDDYDDDDDDDDDDDVDGDDDDDDDDGDDDDDDDDEEEEDDDDDDDNGDYNIDYSFFHIQRKHFFVPFSDEALKRMFSMEFGNHVSTAYCPSLHRSFYITKKHLIILKKHLFFYPFQNTILSTFPSSSQLFFFIFTTLCFFQNFFFSTLHPLSPLLPVPPRVRC